jgi:hypothetical protein
MRNLILLGSGRSGTSAVASLFRNVPGIFYGYDVLAPTIANPRGYYEDEVVNAVNNILLRQITGTMLLDLVPERLLPWVERRFSWMHRDTRSLWIARPRRPLRWRLGYDIAHLIGRICSHQPFCLKDPRFCFTLPMWMPYLPEGVRFLAVVRRPAATVQSMMRDASELYERPLALTRNWAFEHWQLAQEKILAMRGAQGADHWLIVDFDEVLNGAAMPAIEAFAECKVDVGAIDTRIIRSETAPELSTPQACIRLYETMVTLARQNQQRWLPAH